MDLPGHCNTGFGRWYWRCHRVGEGVPRQVGVAGARVIAPNILLPRQSDGGPAVGRLGAWHWWRLLPREGD